MVSQKTKIALEKTLRVKGMNKMVMMMAMYMTCTIAETRSRVKIRSEILVRQKRRRSTKIELGVADQQTDRPTDEQILKLIEMRGRI